jgi:hypothetical protein
MWNLWEKWTGADFLRVLPFPWQPFHRLLHTHHHANAPRGLGLTSPQQTPNKKSQLDLPNASSRCVDSLVFPMPWTCSEAGCAELRPGVVLCVGQNRFLRMGEQLEEALTCQRCCHVYRCLHGNTAPKTLIFTQLFVLRPKIWPVGPFRCSVA